IAEAGMEDDKRQDRNLAKAEAARRLARLQRGLYWIGTEKHLTQRRHYNLVFLHARRQRFPTFADIALAVQKVWPWGEVANVEEIVCFPELSAPGKSTTVDASALPEPRRVPFHRNLRAVELVLAGASQTSVAKESGISRSTLSRLVQRTRQMGQVACIPHGSYTRQAALHPAFQECIRRLFLLPTRLSMTAIHEHTEMRQVAARLADAAGQP